MDSVTHLLDTHAAIWVYQNSPSLGSEARQVVDQAPAFALAVSDFSLMGIAMLIFKGRLHLDTLMSGFLRKIEETLVVLPLAADAAAIAMELPLSQADAFDRAIVATAKCRKLTLLTKDRQITDSGLVAVLW